MCHDILFCFAFVFFVFGNGLSGSFHMLFFFFFSLLVWMGWMMDGQVGCLGLGLVVERAVIRDGA